MFGDDPEMVHSSRSAISTGQLPDSDDVKTAVDETYEQFSSVDDGEVPDYIPALADADPDLFGICIVSTEGQAYSRGDAELLFTIQSISKAFVFALVREEVGHTKARELVGVNNTGLPFDSVMAIEINGGRTMNPLVNAGALATSALAPGRRGRRSGTSSSAASRPSRGATWRSTRTRSSRSGRTTSATRASRASSRATGTSPSTRTR